jgi:hypothetical protein|tara:strand:+ start:224 stop:556 length:333 start_codon:yes stop_codon:yes gene_type:complete
MSFTNVTRGQGKFVSRTNTPDVQHPGGQVQLVHRVEPNEIFEPTGSNVSTAFMVVSQSTEIVAAPYTRFNADLAGGGSIDGQGLVIGEMYNVALSSVSSSLSGSTVDLFR